MKPYSIYSKFYDLVEGPQEDKIEFIKQLIAEYNPDTKTLLEIACGTGNILQEFENVYETAGLDLSEDMLKIAQVKLKNSELIPADMRDFDLKKGFDTILCIYDSINHLLEIKDWDKTFERVHNHLNDGGIFIFDLNTEFRLLVLEELSPFVLDFDDNTLIMEINRKTEYLYENNIRIFEKNNDGLYKLHKETISEATFPFEKINDLLDKYFNILTGEGFSSVEDSEIPAHKFLVCQKK